VAHLCFLRVHTTGAKAEAAVVFRHVFNLHFRVGTCTAIVEAIDIRLVVVHQEVSALLHARVRAAQRALLHRHLYARAVGSDHPRCLALAHAVVARPVTAAVVRARPGGNIVRRLRAVLSAPSPGAFATTQSFVTVSVATAEPVPAAVIGLTKISHPPNLAVTPCSGALSPAATLLSVVGGNPTNIHLAQRSFVPNIAQASEVRGTARTVSPARAVRPAVVVHAQPSLVTKVAHTRLLSATAHPMDTAVSERATVAVLALHSPEADVARASLQRCVAVAVFATHVRAVVLVAFLPSPTQLALACLELAGAHPVLPTSFRWAISHLAAASLVPKIAVTPIPSGFALALAVGTAPIAHGAVSSSPTLGALAAWGRPVSSYHIASSVATAHVRAHVDVACFAAPSLFALAFLVFTVAPTAPRAVVRAVVVRARSIAPSQLADASLEVRVATSMSTAAVRRASVAFAARPGEADLTVAAKSGGTGISSGIDALSPFVVLVTLVGTERNGTVAASPAVVAFAHALDALPVVAGGNAHAFAAGASAEAVVALASVGSVVLVANTVTTAIVSRLIRQSDATEATLRVAVSAGPAVLA